MLRARRYFLCLPAFCCASTLPLLAAGLQDNGEYRLARQALGDGLPGVAATKATRLLTQGPWTEEERRQLAELAVEAWVRARDGAAALQLLKTETPTAKAFWEAQARMLTGDVDAARQGLESRLQSGETDNREKLLLAQVWLAGNQAPQARDLLVQLREAEDAATAKRARLMLDELDLSLGNVQTAAKDLESLPAGEQETSTQLLKARALVEMAQYPQAESALRTVITSSGGGERVHHMAAVLLADVLLKQDKTAECQESLVQFLDNTTESRMWSEAFDLLALALEKDPRHTQPPDAALRWITEGNTVQRQALLVPPSTGTFRGHAMLLMSRWLLSQKRTLEGLGLLEAMLQVHHGHPQGAEAMRLALETYGALKVDTRVTALANQWRSQYGAGQSAMVDFVTGGTAYARRDYTQAASLFQAAANVAVTLSERRASLYNAAVAALRAGELALYQQLLGQLEVVSAGNNAAKTADTAADLELDEALDLAARAQPAAAERLRSFIQKHPGHPRQVQARLSLAELLLLQIPTDFPAIEKLLTAAAAPAGITEGQQQQIAITRLWMLDKQGNLKGVTEAGTAFLKSWPQASQAANVRMKVADAYYRLENFASARTEFELVAQENASSPLGDTALYFAGLAAVSMMSDEGREDAINLWQELAERGGPLSIPARQQQALAKRRAGQEAEALTLLDSLLTEKNLPEDMRYSLTCERAEILMLLGKTNPAQIEKAVASLRLLLAENSLTYLWSARAGYTLAAVLNTAGRTTEALEACYNVVQAEGFTGPSNPAEYRWYYRAGFFGIDLLETSQQWEAAARLAEKLSLSSGDRAAEARELATRIRLEHFLWDSKAP